MPQTSASIINNIVRHFLFVFYLAFKKLTEKPAIPVIPFIDGKYCGCFILSILSNPTVKWNLFFMVLVKEKFNNV